MINGLGHLFGTHFIDHFRAYQTVSSVKIIKYVSLDVFVRVKISEKLEVTSVHLPLEPMLKRLLLFMVWISDLFHNISESLNFHQSLTSFFLLKCFQMNSSDFILP